MLGIIGLGGCSDNGDASFENAQIKLSLSSVMCVEGTPSTTDIMSYKTLISGDTIVKEDNNATVVIYHDINGVKKVCLLDNNASAYILR